MMIKTIRKELGLSQADFARLFGVHQTAVSQWETGRTCPDIDMVIRIARGTGHSVDELLGVCTQGGCESAEHTLEIVMNDDSMAGARIRKGDRAYVRPSEKCGDGSLAGIRRKGVNTVRYIKIIGGETYFLNAQTPPVIEKAEETDAVLGPVFGFYSAIDEGDRM